MLLLLLLLLLLRDKSQLCDARECLQSPSHTSCRIDTITIAPATLTCALNLSFSLSSRCNSFSKRARLAFCCRHRVTESK
jgi:hypothetical protein